MQETINRLFLIYGSAEPAKYQYIPPWRFLAIKSCDPQIPTHCTTVVPQSTCIRQLPHEGDLVTDIRVTEHSFRYFCVSPILLFVQLGLLRAKGRTQPRKSPYGK